MTRWAYPALAFCTGAAVTIFEFAAPNLFRAYFGQTIYVWANVIGVILAALALGYTVGGRWADRTRTGAPLACVLAFAGVYGLLVGWCGPAVSGWLAGPQEYTQDTALRAFVVESMAASLLLFGPPLIALGMATPLMVQRASAAWPVGHAAGLVFGIGTVGSLAGIYLTTFVLLEWVGVVLTIRLAAGALLLLACVVWLGGGRRRAAAVAAALAVASPFGADAPWDDLPPAGAELVLAIESPYQLVRVVDRPRPDGGGTDRWLAFDEGMGTYHSIQVDETTRWTGAYYDAFACVPDWIGKQSLRICIVGNAAGTMSLLLRTHHPHKELAIDGVEIDPAVTEAARRTMGLEDSWQRIVHADGRTFLGGMPAGSYDAIIVDAYARQVSIPAGLSTREFFALAKSRLKPGGMLFLNLGALRPGSRLVRVVADTLAAGFDGPPVYRCPLVDQSNVLLVAGRDGPVAPPPAGAQLGIADSFARHVPSGGLVLTDDRCPVEALTAADLLLR